MRDRSNAEAAEVHEAVERTRSARTIIAVVGGALLLVIALLLIPRTCAPTIQIPEPGTSACTYPDYRPLVATITSIVVMLGGVLAASGMVAGRERRTFMLRAGLTGSLAAAALGAAVILYLANGPPFGTLL